MPLLANLLGLRLDAAESARIERIAGESLEKLLHRAIGQLLIGASAARPLVVVMDDLHWADESSLELLTGLLPLARGHAILFALLARPGHAATVGRVEEAARAAGLEPLVLRLEPLSRSAARELLASLFATDALPHATRAVIEAKAQGNPFFLEEVVRTLVDEGAIERVDGRFRATERIHDVAIPDTLHEVVMARVDHLPALRRSLLQLASVIGRSFHESVLVAVVGEHVPVSDELAALAAADFVEPWNRTGGVEWAFAHPLLQEVTYDGLLQTRREELHRQVAHAIDTQLPDEVPGRAGMLAWHYGKGRDTERAEEFLFRAGEDAARVAASSEALHFFQEAWKLYAELHGDGGDPNKKARLAHHVALALFHRGRLLEADAYYQQALEQLGVRVPRSTGRMATAFLGDALAVLAQLVSPERSATRPASDVDRQIIAIMYERAQTQTTASPTRFVLDSVATLARLGRIDPSTVPGAGGMYAGAVGIFSYGGVSFALGRRFLARASKLVRPDDVADRIHYQMMSQLHHVLAGDWSDAHVVGDELLEDGLRYGRLWEVTNALNLDGLRQLYRGAWDSAASCAERLAKIAEQYRYDLAASAQRFLLAMLRLERRDLAGAIAAARRIPGRARGARLPGLRARTPRRVAVAGGRSGGRACEPGARRAASRGRRAAPALSRGGLPARAAAPRYGAARGVGRRARRAAACRAQPARRPARRDAHRVAPARGAAQCGARGVARRTERRRATPLGREPRLRRDARDAPRARAHPARDGPPPGDRRRSRGRRGSARERPRRVRRARPRRRARRSGGALRALVNRMLRLAATALSALAFGLAFPPASVKPLAWVALVPFLLGLRGAGLATALALGEVWTLIAAWTVGSWMPAAVSTYFLQPPWLGWVFFFGVSTGMAGIYYMAFAVVYRRFVGRLDPRWMPWATAAAWTAAEVGRGRLFTAIAFLSNPWGLVGYSQVGIDSAVQVASLFGVYGIGFAIAAANAAIAEALVLVWRGDARARPRSVLAIGIAPAAGLFAFGAIAMHRAPPRDQKAPGARPVAVVQGHVNLERRWRSDSYGKNFDVYLAGAQEAFARSPGALVVWPESALDFFLEREELYQRAIARVAAAGGGEVAVGGPRQEGDDPAPRYFNSVFLVDGAGRVSAPYDKQALVPFTEYPPLAGLDLVRRRFEGVRFFSFGAPTPPLATRAGRAGVLLCNEGMLPEMAGRRVAAGAQFLVNPSNDTWIPSSRFADHLFDIVRLRAVEQRRWLVRASTSGPSAIVDPWGRVQVRSAPFERAVETGWIEPRDDRSLYGWIGDAFAFACVAALPIAWWAGRRGSRAATR